jgi:hypothetical protein
MVSWRSIGQSRLVKPTKASAREGRTSEIGATLPSRGGATMGRVGSPEDLEHGLAHKYLRQPPPQEIFSNLDTC